MRTSLLLVVADDMRHLADSLQALAEAEAAPEASPAPSPAVTLEQVRAVLADKSQDGKLAEVRALISMYGANKLSEVDPQHYAALLADAEEL